MTVSMFAKATKKKARLRLAIAGASGSGKTFTALTVGKHIGNRMAVIDTERGSASKYVRDVADFDTCELEHFAVQRYLQAIKNAAESGYDVLVIDSLSHAWAGKGGILEEADKRGGKFGAWRDLTPLQQSLMDAILSYPGHVIATMRSKMAYEVTTDESKGRKETKVEKIGLAHVQRDDVSYEFDVMLDMDEKNNARVTKTRCPALTGQVLSKPGKDLADTLLAWLSDGEAAPERPLAVAADTAQTSSAKSAASQRAGTRTTSTATTGASTPTSATVDEYGLTVPTCPCPVVRPGKANAGKRWDELPGALIAKMLDESGHLMSADQSAWAEYLVTKRQARKAREAEQAAAAEAAIAAQEGSAEPAGAEADCGADPADGQAAQ